MTRVLPKQSVLTQCEVPGAQLILPLPWRPDPTFENFFPGSNLLLFDYLKKFVEKQGEWFVYLWGDKGVGCSHLLQACCHAVLSQNRRAIYLPLQGVSLNQMTPAILDHLENYDLIGLEDIDHVLGHPNWEEALFYFYNRIHTEGGCLLVTAKQSPINLPCKLSDLHSRLVGGVDFEVIGLNDEEKLLALQQYARLRGLELSVEVGQYLLRHYPRNMSDLMNILEKLDRASMAAQRRLTIPFVRNCL